MPVFVEDSIFDPGAAPVHGRPDFLDRGFGVTRARRHPPYVFGTRGNACLLHRVAFVDLHWYALTDAQTLRRLTRPALLATTVCGVFFRLDRQHARTCQIPAPEAVACGRCHGQIASFSRRTPRADGLTRREARRRLGCAVAGIPQEPTV